MINKVTKLYSSEGLDEAIIQAHFDELNDLGWNLVALDNVGGWYRFFWEKQEE
jgi:endo-alpha-1,4-polygalactosaminidase (GH114 family)